MITRQPGTADTDLIDILYRDEHILAVHKPPNVLVHRSELAPRETALMPMLRDYIGQWVYPVHRIDRATSGLVLFALHPEAATALCTLFEQRRLRKVYLAVVRGFIPEAGTIDKNLTHESGGKIYSAATGYRSLARLEIARPLGPYATVRSSLAELQPYTGRRHQLRRHCRAIAHPILGDVKYGDGKHNRFYREYFGLHRLLLIACSLEFRHPYTGALLRLHTKPELEIQSLLNRFEFHNPHDRSPYLCPLDKGN